MIAIIDYKAGNLTSVQRALEKIGEESIITHEPEKILNADHVIFPGVGAAGAAMDSLNESEIGVTLKNCLKEGKPVLGICLGTQIIMESSEEDGGVDCLGIIPGHTIRFQFNSPNVTVPQMGWNQVNFAKEHPIFENIQNGTNFYFVHSYYPSPENAENALAKTEYSGLEFTSALTMENLVATQFHPEKSGRHGLDLLKNFAQWDGRL
ncbi:MAG: imidazole glycerol phosphate synthase subunit HisH [Lentisphaeraceae bacterium]|nr:imidazole glycerol phosphate synthase subunit HisH [Lentisphaeraceae bacterium]